MEQIWTTFTTTFKVTDMISSLMGLIAFLLNKDNKITESKYFQEIANLFR